MYKVCSFPGVDPHSGDATVQLIKPGDAAALEKTAQVIHPIVQKYVARLKPDKGKVYVLIIALGASEYYGQNINGDIFPEKALTHKGTDYGYQTFLNGHVFRHHQNKDPNVSFGAIVLSVWNDTMKRVELILVLDKARAALYNATDIIEKIEAGVPLSVSMGCKVPYDICTICHNKAKTRANYCYHLLHEMNNIYADGRQAGAVNTMPRFFDLSFVFIGADRIAKTICKIASNGCCPLCETVAANLNMKKTAAQKQSVAIKKSVSQKQGDIVKDTPSNFVRRAVPMLEDSEPDIPRGILNAMGSSCSLQDSLSTVSSMGMVLKPREFQRIVLIKLRMGPTADQLDRTGEVFRPTREVDNSLTFGKYLPSLAQKLMPLLRERSAFGPVLRQRMLKILVVQPKLAAIQKTSKKGFLDKIAQAYNGYRLRVLSDMPNNLSAVLDENPDLRAELFRESFVDMFSKQGAAGTNLIPLKPLLGMFPILYYLSAHWKAQEVDGKRLGFVKKFVAENPELSTILAAGLWGQARKRPMRVAT